MMISLSNAREDEKGEAKRIKKKTPRQQIRRASTFTIINQSSTRTPSSPEL